MIIILKRNGYLKWTGYISFGQGYISFGQDTYLSDRDIYLLDRGTYIFRTRDIYHSDRIGQVFNFRGLSDFTRGLDSVLKVCCRIWELLTKEALFTARLSYLTVCQQHSFDIFSSLHHKKTFHHHRQTWELLAGHLVAVSLKQRFLLWEVCSRQPAF